MERKSPVSGGLRASRWVNAALALTCVTLLAACKADPELRPDALLREELGLTDYDEVYQISITGGAVEVAEPAETTVEGGAYVEFVTTDWLVHEIIFEIDGLAPEAQDFLERTDQVASPPLLRLDSRFVLDFREAPAGRYPYAVEGSGASGRGVVIVVKKP